jgi:methylthioribose-1-phosphate isomerase
VVARENGIPVYPVVPTSTIDLTVATGDGIHIEERNAEEVTVIGGVRVAPDECPVFNPAFDVTPHKYVTGIITVCRLFWCLDCLLFIG